MYEFESLNFLVLFFFLSAVFFVLSFCDGVCDRVVFCFLVESSSEGIRGCENGRERSGVARFLVGI